MAGYLFNSQKFNFRHGQINTTAEAECYKTT